MIASERAPTTMRLTAQINVAIGANARSLSLQKMASASTIASKDFLTAAGKSSASMFCHFNSSRAIVLLQLGRTEKGKPSRAAGAWTMFHKFVTQIRDQPRVVPGARAIHTGCFERRQS